MAEKKTIFENKKMKSIFLYVLLIGLLFPLRLKAQLTAEEKESLLTFWARDEKLSQFSEEIRNKALNDSTHAEDLKVCAKYAKKANDLDSLNKIDDIGVLYKKLEEKFGYEYAKKNLPDYKYWEYQNFRGKEDRISAILNDKEWFSHVDQYELDELANAYIQNKRDFAKEFKDDEKVKVNEHAYTVLKGELKESVNKMKDGFANLWADKIVDDSQTDDILFTALEIRYWNRVATEATANIVSDKEQVEHEMSLCYTLSAKLMEKVTDEQSADNSVVGTWIWSWAQPGKKLEEHGTVTFTSDGKINEMKWSGGSFGTWTQSGQSVSLKWSDKKYEDTMTLSADGKKLSGANNAGWTVEGTR